MLTALYAIQVLWLRSRTHRPGVSWWVTDSQGAILETSESIPPTQIQQRVSWWEGALAPSIRTTTNKYSAEWALGPTGGRGD